MPPLTTRGLGEVGAELLDLAAAAGRRRAAARRRASSAAKISGCGSGARVASPGSVAIEVEPERLRLRPASPARRRRCRRAASGPAGRAARRSGRPMSLSIARIRSSRCLWSACVPWLKFSRNTSAPASNQRLDGGAVGAGRARAWRRSWRCRVRCMSVVSSWIGGRRCTMARKSFTLVSVGPVTTESPSASKKPWPSLSSRRSRGLHALRPGARQRVGRQQRAGDLFLAVDAVGVAGQRMDAGLAVSATPSDSRNSTLRPPRPVPRRVTVVSPPDSSTHGARERLAAARHLQRDAGQRLGDVARLALDGVAEDVRRAARRRAPPAPPLRAPSAAWR